MIRHPNDSGMRMDPISRGSIAAHCIDGVEVRQGDVLIFKMEGGVSQSEDPVFRSSFTRDAMKTLRVEAHDNLGGIYEGE